MKRPIASPGTPADDQEICRDVSLACQILAANGHDDFVWGHVAIRDPRGRGVWMKAGGLGFEEVTPADVVLVGFDGELVAGAGRRHAEWPIHTEVMLARPDVAASLHSHPPYCGALAASGVPLRAVSQPGSLFVPPDVPRFTQTSNLIVTRELGQAVAAALGEQHALLLVNHGILTTGESIKAAVVRAVLLEKACQHQVLTASLGGPAHWTGDADALEKRQTAWAPEQLDALWDYLARTAPAPAPR